MAIIKCKMCGGDLNIAENNSVAVCEYCGTQQTVPSADNEKKLTLFGRANRLRMACEFDKAAGVYESIVVDFPEEAEAYWGLVLCKYGIEYVDDPATGKKIPTCHRSSFDSVMDDANLDQALENADVIAQKVYREEAKQFERIRKGILEVSSSEKPYDIFICYKETDEKGDRTLDSVMAQDLYAALTDKGYRVFFSRLTLQGKLGEAYEPYIFAALNSAKVMLAVGTCYEYYNAVWVKNEWSRYLKICEADKSKHLIPCYKDLDPEDMPKEFRHLQGADLGKMGAVQDILFNMEKYIPLKKTVKETVVVQQAQNNATAPLLKRAFMFLEDGDWKRADDLCEQVLNMDPECAEAYLGKLMAELRVRNKDSLKDCAMPFDGKSNYNKALRFGNDSLQNELKGYITHIESRNLENAYNAALRNMNVATTEEEYKKVAVLFSDFGDYKDAKQLVDACYEKAEFARKDAIYKHAKRDMQGEVNQWSLNTTASLFESIGEHKDAVVLAKECREKAEELRKNSILAEANVCMQRGSLEQHQAAVKYLESIPGWKDADELLARCKKEIPQLEEKEKAKAEARRLERERQEEAARQETARKAAQKKKNKTIAVVVAILAVIAIIAVVVVTTVVIPNGKYNDAVALMSNGQYEEAALSFETLKDYKDAARQASSARENAKQERVAILKEAGLEVSNEGYLVLGRAEQKTLSNTEPIEWIPLAIKDNKALLISRYALTNMTYGDSSSTWEDSSMRHWLNSTFLEFAFTAEERSLIVETVNVTAEITSYLDDEIETSENAQETRDKVFLLSAPEVVSYFGSDPERYTEATKVAKEHGAYEAGNGNTWWAVRSQSRYPMFVGAESGFGEATSSAVRPAMWIDLNA